MAKSKAQHKAVPAPQKVLSSVKNGRVTKPLQATKAKSKEIVKTAVSKQFPKKAKVEESSSEEDSEEGSEEDSEDGDSDAGSDSSDDSESDASEEDLQNSVKGVNGAAHSDSGDSDDSESDDEVPAKVSVKTNGVPKDTKAGAEEEDSGDSFHSVHEKPAPRFEADSDADSDDDDDEGESSEDSESDEEEVVPATAAAPVKVNGSAKDEVESAEDDSEEDESEDSESEEEVAPKKRKAEEDVPAPTKKAKVEVDDDAQEGPNGESTNLFVGRISWATDDDALYHEFSQFGEITGCRVVYDKDSGRSKGFGYVQFAKLSEAIAAKEAKHNALFDGRNINVDFSQPRGAKPKEAMPDRAKRYGDVQGTPADTLFVGNLSFDATYDIVRETFEPFGDITRISLPTDRESGQMKGFGYVSYGSIDEAKAAIDALTGSEIAGRRVRLDYATARAGGDGSSPARGGGFGGRGGGRGFGGRGGRGDRGGRGGRGGFGGRGRGGSTNRGGFGDFQGKKISF